MAEAPWTRINSGFVLACLRTHRLKDSDVRVLLVLCDRSSNKPPRSCWPSLATIAKDSGLNRGSVVRSLDRLVAAGLLQIVPRPGAGGRPNSNEYILIEDPLDHFSENGKSPESEAAAKELTGAPAQRDRRAGATMIGAPARLELDPRELDPGTRSADLINLVLEEEQKPKLSEIEISETDLQNPEILQTVFRKCVELGYAHDSDRHLLEFFTAAIHARASGAEPLRLFWSLVWRGEFLRRPPKIGSEDEFEQAQAWRRELKRRESERRFGPIAAEWSKGPVSMAALLKRIVPAILHSQN